MAGREVVEVDPSGTSQTCPACGRVEAKLLSQRIHRCPCGCVLDRDVAAAKVILSRGARDRGGAILAPVIREAQVAVEDRITPRRLRRSGQRADAQWVSK